MSSPNVLPAPDLTGYVDLRIFDVSDQEVVDTALANLALNLPGWVPNEANIEVVILEALALQMAEGIVAVNRLPGAVVVAVLKLMGIEPDYGNPPNATATITFGDTLGHEVPGGTRIALTLDDGSTVVFLVEPPGVVVTAGNSSGVVSLIGDEFTAAANGTAAGAAMFMVDRLTFVDSVVLATDVADGRDPETDDEYRDRGVARLSRLSDALVVPRHFTAAALEDPDVAAALTLDNLDPQPGHVAGDDPGHVTVAVLGDGGAPLSSGAKTALEESMEERAVAMLDVHVIDATIVAVPVTTTVVPTAGADFSTVETSVEDAIEAYLDPLTWQFGATIYLNEMISLIDRVDGVDRVVSVTLNGVAADFALTGIAAVPNAGTVTVTEGP
jgi:uncharacterized phage protein gp47/JayE